MSIFYILIVKTKLKKTQHRINLFFPYRFIPILWFFFNDFNSNIFVLKIYSLFQIFQTSNEENINFSSRLTRAWQIHRFPHHFPTAQEQILHFYLQKRSFFIRFLYVRNQYFAGFETPPPMTNTAGFTTAARLASPYPDIFQTQPQSHPPLRRLPLRHQTHLCRNRSFIKNRFPFFCF